MSVPSFAATGRRKNAIARVNLAEGNGTITIKGRAFEDYFPTVTLQNQVLAPMTVTGTSQSFDIVAKTTGGGVTGQMGAIRLGLSRALILANPENRPVLKQNGFLTRDPRMKERKKSGRPGARKRFQFSKR